jgi:hypothetical protein
VDDRVEDRSGPGVARWLEGNTAARGRDRLLGALRVFDAAGLLGPGSMASARWAMQARQALHEAGAARIKHGSTDTSAAGKMQNTMFSYGWIHPLLPESLLVGRLQDANRLHGALTPSGRRMLDARSEADISARFCEALARRILPSPFTAWAGASFCPFALTLAVLFALEEQTGARGNAYLDATDMAAVVQFHDASTGPHEIARIVLSRRRHFALEGDGMGLNSLAMEEAASRTQRIIKGPAANSYATTIMNYYSGTGLCELTVDRPKGVLRLSHDPSMRQVALAIAERPDPVPPNSDPGGYLSSLWEGGPSWTCHAAARGAAPSWPTRSADLAGQDRSEGADAFVAAALRRMMGIVEAREIVISSRRVPAVDAETLAREEQAMADPARAWPDVRGLLAGLHANSRVDMDGVSPPALYEFCLFRAGALLAGRGGLQGRVSSMRGFAIASDLMPVRHASGGQADILLRIGGGLVVALEGTLSLGSRQMASEAEPVRRHTAEGAVRHPGMRVIGVFVSPEADMNTVEWFQKGMHWNDERPQRQVACDVVPLTTSQLMLLGDAAFNVQGGSPEWLQDLLEACLARRSAANAPAWLAAIDECVRASVRVLGLNSQVSPPAPTLRKAPARILRERSAALQTSLFLDAA